MSAPSRAGVRLLTHVATRPCRVPRQLCPRLVFFRPVSSPASASEAPPPATASTTAANAKSSPSTFHNLAAGLSDQPATDDGLLDLGGSSSSPHDWTRSFHGLSVSPFTPEQAEILMQAIPDDDVEIKPDGIVYLPEIKYRRILNKAFGPGGWGMAPRGETLITDRLVTREYALVAGGRLISVARGEQAYFDANGIPTATEGCKSNALMRCCKDLGIASELWDPRHVRTFLRKHAREVFAEHTTTKRRRKYFIRIGEDIPYPFKECSPHLAARVAPRAAGHALHGESILSEVGGGRPRRE